MLLFASCGKQPSIVGTWRVTGYSNGTDATRDVVTYSFQKDNSGRATIEYENDSVEVVELVWNMVGDTLVFYDVTHDSEEPTMPAVMLVEKLDKEEMTWLFLIVGDIRIWLHRVGD